MATWSRQWVLKIHPDDGAKVGEILTVNLRNGGTQSVMVEAISEEIRDDDNGEYMLAIGTKVKKS